MFSKKKKKKKSSTKTILFLQHSLLLIIFRKFEVALQDYISINRILAKVTFSISRSKPI